MNEVARELARRLISEAERAFRENAWICPWRGFGYFADAKDRGVRGAAMLGALAVAAGVVRPGYGPGKLLNALVAWRDDHPDWRDRWHLTYGISDGWDGDAVNEHEYETWPHNLVGGRHRSPQARDYRLGYAIGRRAANRLGLPLPARPVRADTPELHRAYIDAKLAKRATTTREGRASCSA